MWNKKNDKLETTSLNEIRDTRTIDGEKASGPSHFNFFSSSTQSIIGKSMVITGEIRAEEDVTIEGTVEGKIKTSRALSVGQSGRVKADVQAGMITISGEVIGNIVSQEKVLLKPTAHVVGNITCVSFTVNEGASYEGNITMKHPQKKPGGETAGERPDARDTTPKPAVSKG